MTSDKTPDDVQPENRQPGGRPASPQGSSPDEFSVFMPARGPRTAPATRQMLLMGVAAACVLGVGLGIWARPAMSERKVSVARPADAAPAVPLPAHKLEIVIDDHPAPLGAPIEVLSDRTAQPLIMPAPVIAKARPALTVPVHLAKAAAAPKPAAKPAPKIDLARAAAAKEAGHKLALAQAAQAAQAAKTTKDAHLRLAKTAHQHQIELAKAVALAEAHDDQRKRLRLASFVHAVQKALPHTAKPHRAPAEVAKLDRKHPHKATRHEARIEQAALKTRKAAPRIVRPAYRVHAAPVAPPPRPSGLMKVSAPHCVNRDPGEALVCADPSLGAADRQLARAYQSARAAGVPDAQLRQQQQRWLSARSSAAREAPWAVHDVYLARIAELNGQAHDAHDEND